MLPGPAKRSRKNHSLWRSSEAQAPASAHGAYERCLSTISCRNFSQAIGQRFSHSPQSNKTPGGKKCRSEIRLMISRQSFHSFYNQFLDGAKVRFQRLDSVDFRRRPVWLVLFLFKKTFSILYYRKPCSLKNI